MSFIPTIDLLHDPPSTQAEKVKTALGTYGFFAIDNTGVPTEDVSSIFSDVNDRIARAHVQMKSFFALPETTKRLLPSDTMGLGYIPPLSQALGPYRRDYRETFQYGRKGASPSALQLPPPFDSSSVEDRLKAFQRSLHGLSERLLELFAMALDVSGAQVGLTCSCRSRRSERRIRSGSTRGSR